ncbi:MAG: hypothetical protein QME81_15215 [bacterium]|nr:hypothetical protein [bacterium]
MFKTQIRCGIFFLSLFFILVGLCSGAIDWKGRELIEIEELDYGYDAGTIAVTEDELTMIILAKNGWGLPSEGAADLLISTRNSVNEEWGVPENINNDKFQKSGLPRVNQINTGAESLPPAINGDGTILVWEDKRDVNDPDNPLANYRQIWISTKDPLTDLWGPAMNINDYNIDLARKDDVPEDQLGNYRLNTVDIQGDPEISKDGLELYISREPEGGPVGEDDRDIWIATRPDTSKPFGALQNLDDYNKALPGGKPLNCSTKSDENPAISNDGLLMFFLSGRDGHGFDIYMTTRADKNSAWGSPINISKQQGWDEFGGQWGIDFVGDSNGGLLYLCVDTTGEGRRIHVVDLDSIPVTIYSIADQNGVRMTVRAQGRAGRLSFSIDSWQEWKGDPARIVPDTFSHLF